MKNFKNYISIFAAVILLQFFCSCKKENMCDCIKRTGSIVNVSREITGFDKIVVEDNVNVFITQDSTYAVEVEAGKNIEPLIKAEVTGGTLTIQNKNRCNWTRSYDKPLNVYVKMPVIKYITSNGTGNIKSLNTITSISFDVRTENSGNIELTVNNSKVISHMFGYGDITLHGTTSEHDCSIGGNGFLYCSDLHTGYTWVQSFTTGLCYVNASNLLICQIEQIGDVYCYGHPTMVQKTQTGSGQLYLQ
jgi:hypothetical protein